MEAKEADQMRREFLMMSRRVRRYLERIRGCVNPDERAGFEKIVSQARHIEAKYSKHADILRADPHRCDFYPCLACGALRAEEKSNDG